MNTEQQKQFKIDWVALLIIPLIQKLIALLGEAAKDKLDELFDKANDVGGATTNTPTCPPGQEYNPITGKCQDPIG